MDLEVYNAILAYHYSDRLKAIFIIAGNLLSAYEDSRTGVDIIHALFDALKGEVAISTTILSEKAGWASRDLDTASRNIDNALLYFDLQDIRKSTECIANAVSNVTTLAERSMKELKRLGVWEAGF